MNETPRHANAGAALRIPAAPAPPRETIHEVFPLSDWDCWACVADGCYFAGDMTEAIAHAVGHQFDARPWGLR